jgi:Protein of unknown function (DUF3224)
MQRGFQEGLDGFGAARGSTPAAELCLTWVMSRSVMTWPTLAAEVIETMTDMTSTATGTFTIKGWDQQPYAEAEGAPKLTHARVTTACTGDEPEVAYGLRWGI